jgi:tetratricopeptide (TPR) repeat protein
MAAGSGPGTGPVAGFCADLRELRRGSGRDPVALASQLKISRTQLYAILNGEIKRPPDWTKFVEPLVQACTSGDPKTMAQWRRRHAVLVDVCEELRRQGRRSGQPGPSASAPAPPKVIRTLRADTAAFTGRSDQIEKITRALSGSPGTVVTIHAIDGMPGVGKTALAVHAGHLLAGQFPDGQLFVDLHAYSVDYRPVDPAEALAGLLRAAGVPPGQIPDGLEERAARWRDQLAGRRVLLVLDDAASAEQVVPLLPGSADCMVLVTSRRRLTRLRRDYGAWTMSLDTLPATEAVTLFTRVAGRPVAGAGQDAAGRLVRLCGYLPLAITILAAALEPAAAPADLLADLEAAQDGLAGIDAQLGDQGLGVAAAFDLSYQALATEARRVLRLLAVTPGADLDAYATAALTGLSVMAARQQLAGLHAHRLIDQPTYGRYRLHDLITDYARARTTAGERGPAIERLLDYYQHAAAEADRRLARHSRPGRRTGSPSRAEIPGFSSQEYAAAWLRAERANLLACISHTRHDQQPARLADLTASLAALLWLDGPWTQGIGLHSDALAASRELADRSGEAYTLSELGDLRLRTGDYPQAVRLLEQSLSILPGPRRPQRRGPCPVPAG